MSTEQETAKEEPAAEEVPATEQPKLRRRPFGYRKRDVRAALEHQSAELGAREAELAELRQDIAALWLAFAQHDRMIRRALGEEDPRPAAPPTGGQEAPEPAEGAQKLSDHEPAAAEDDAAIGRQLSDLDDVLAAIELATQTLERTYVAETGRRPAGDQGAADGEKQPDA